MFLLREARPQELGVPEARSRQDQVDSERKPNQRPGPPQVQVLHKLLHSHASALTVSGRDPDGQVYMWMLTQCSTHLQGLMLLDPSATVLACPPSFVGNKCDPVLHWLEVAQCERGRGGTLQFNQRSEAAGESSVRHQLRGGTSQWPDRVSLSA